MKSLAEERAENYSIEGQAIFAQSRPRLQAIAYRMLGTIEEAEDMVQETFLKWQQVSLPEIQSPQAYLTTIITRLCIDYLRSARVRREQYIGTWLPEPIVSHKFDEPKEMVELADSLAMAFLVMLERLSPIERAIFLLREVFEYDYDEISSIVAKNVPNCRQIVRRAKQHLKTDRSRFQVSLARQEQLTHKFIAACDRGDLTGLIELLTADITLFSDGGGKVKALLKPIQGANKVARFLIALGRSKLIPRKIISYGHKTDHTSPSYPVKNSLTERLYCCSYCESGKSASNSVPDEIARLKGEKEKPKIKPSRLEPAKVHY